MNINDLDPNEYEVVEQKQPVLNINDLKPDEYEVVGESKEASPAQPDLSLADRVDAIANKYQIEPSEARKYAELAGTTEPLGEDDSVLTRMAGLTGEKFLGGLPAFAYKKFQDDNTEKAFDEIRREVDKEKSYADMAVEMAGSIVPGTGITKGLSLGAKGLGALAVGEGAVSGLAESDVGQEADMAGLGAGLGVAGVGLGAGLGKLASRKIPNITYEFTEEAIEGLPEGSGFYKVIAKNTDGDVVGSVNFSKTADGALEARSGVNVDEAFRGKGIANEMYDIAEQNVGVKVKPNSQLTPDGERFWNKRNAIEGSPEVFNDDSKLAKIKRYLNPAQLIPGTEAAKGGLANKALIKANQMMPFGGDIDEKTLTELLDPQVRKSIKDFDINASADDVLSRIQNAEKSLTGEVGDVYNKAADSIRSPQSVASEDVNIMGITKGPLDSLISEVEKLPKYYSSATKKAIAGVKDIMGVKSVTPFTETSDNIYKRALEARRYIDSQKSGDAFRALPNHEKDVLGQARSHLNSIIEEIPEGKVLREADALYSGKKEVETFFDSLKTKGEFDLKKMISNMRDGSANDYVLSKKLDKLRGFVDEKVPGAKEALTEAEGAIDALKKTRALTAAKGGVERSLGPTAQGSQIVAHALTGAATGGLSLFGIPITNPAGYLKALDAASGVAKYAKGKIPSFDMPNLPQGSGGVFSRMPAQGVGKFDNEQEDTAASDFINKKGSYQK